MPLFEWKGRFEVILRERHPYIRIDENGSDVRCLGYARGLTQREYQVLRVLVTAERGLTKSEICRLISSDGEPGEKSVAVHICAINKKAEPLGGRRLVENTKKDGYFINKNA